MQDAPAAGDEPVNEIVQKPPPETLAPQPEARAPFVTVKPISTPERAIGAGEVVSLTKSQAAEHGALIRPANAVDLSRWGRAPHEL